MQSDSFVFDGDLLTTLKYEYKDYTYYIDCSTIDCSLAEFDKLDKEYDFWISIVKNGHSIEINNNPKKYSFEYIEKIESIFEEKINVIYKEYIEYDYSSTEKDKFYFTWQYMRTKLSL